MRTEKALTVSRVSIINFKMNAEMQADNSFGVIANDDTGRPRATSSGEDDHDGFSLPLPEQI